MPGGLFRSEDGGDSWLLNRPLWDDPLREEWSGGGADHPGIHSICVDPRDSRHVIVGVSCGGVWSTRDSGLTWRLGGSGMRAEFMPPERQFDPNAQDPHMVTQCRANPDALWVQHHNGIFRSTDAAASWSEIADVRPSAFGFAVAVHPDDAETAWFVPAVKDEKRYPADGRVVVNRTRDGGRTFETLTRGLPQEHAYDLVYRCTRSMWMRQAIDWRSGQPRGRSGSAKTQAIPGRRWRPISRRFTRCGLKELLEQGEPPRKFSRLRALRGAFSLPPFQQTAIGAFRDSVTTKNRRQMRPPALPARLTARLLSTQALQELFRTRDQQVHNPESRQDGCGRGQRASPRKRNFNRPRGTGFRQERHSTVASGTSSPTGTAPMRRFSECRNSRNSIHPARPAEAVRTRHAPAGIDAEQRWQRFGRQITQDRSERYPDHGKLQRRPRVLQGVKGGGIKTSLRRGQQTDARSREDAPYIGCIVMGKPAALVDRTRDYIAERDECHHRRDDKKCYAP